MAPKIVLIEALVERAARAHDKEEAAYRGEPSPWRDLDFDNPDDARFRSDRISAMRVAFEAAGFSVEPSGIEAACIAMGVPALDRAQIEDALRLIRSKGRVDNEAFMHLMERFPLTLRIAGQVLAKSPRETRAAIAAGEVPAEPFLTRFDAACRAEVKP